MAETAAGRGGAARVWIWFAAAIALDQLFYILVAPHAEGGHEGSYLVHWHVIVYALVAGGGLAATGLLGPVQAALFAVLVSCAHAFAVWLAQNFSASDAWHLPEYMPNGFPGGLAGAAVSLFGLVLIARGGRNAIVTAAIFTLVLAIIGGALLPVMLNDDVEHKMGAAQILLLYVPWQLVFSWAVARIAARPD